MKIQLTVHLDGLILQPRQDAYTQELPKFRVAEFVIEPLRYTMASPWSRTSGVSYLAKTRLNLGETSITNPPAVYEKVDVLITCFRLFKRGYLGASLVIGEARAREDQKEPFNFYFGSSARSPEGGMAYGLGLEEVPSLVEFATKIAPIISSEQYASLRNPAFRFFNRGIEDMAPSDYSFAVIDFISCLEALLSPSHAELSHRLSEAVALVTELQPSNREKRYDQVKRLYDKRSKAVHGARADVSLDDAVLAENLARYTLRFCLSYYARGYGKKKMLDDIDSIIFGKTDELAEYAFDFVKI